MENRQQSKYCYPGTKVLINKLDLRDQDKLNEMERLMTANRIYELKIKPLHGSFGIKYLQKIHKYIFQDVYPFAGQIRDTFLSKQESNFCPPDRLVSFGNAVMKELKDERFLKGLDKETFIERSSHYLGEINICHFFREGNGRTQREFFRMLGMKNGYELNWDSVSSREMIDASIKSELDYNAFVNILNKVVVNDLPNEDIIKQFASLSKRNELEI